MTRKDFERIAQVFRVNRVEHCLFTDDAEGAALHMRDSLLRDMCVELQAINSRFNKETFIKACNQ